MEFLQRLWTDEEGQGMTEYGLILALVAVAAILMLIFLGEEINQIFQRAGDALSGGVNDGE